MYNLCLGKRIRNFSDWVVDEMLFVYGKTDARRELMSLKVIKINALTNTFVSVVSNCKGVLNF